MSFRTWATRFVPAKHMSVRKDSCMSQSAFPPLPACRGCARAEEARPTTAMTESTTSRLCFVFETPFEIDRLRERLPDSLGPRDPVTTPVEQVISKGRAEISGSSRAARISRGDGALGCRCQQRALHRRSRRRRILRRSDEPRAGGRRLSPRELDAIRGPSGGGANCAGGAICTAWLASPRKAIHVCARRCYGGHREPEAGDRIEAEDVESWVSFR
jgi:hypothetical protein